MTAEEIQAEIDEITTALSHIRKGGQSYTIGSGPSQRTVTMADYDKLRLDRSRLQQDLDDLENGGGIIVGAIW